MLGVIGHRTTPCSLAASPVYTARGIPAVTPAAADPALTQSSEWFFRTTVDGAQQALYGVAYIREAFRAKTFSVVHDDTPSSVRQGNYVVATATASGLRVDQRHELPSLLDEERVRQVAGALAQQPAQSPIFLLTGGVNGAALIRRLRDAGTERPIMGPTDFTSHRFSARFANLPRAESDRTSIPTDLRPYPCVGRHRLASNDADRAVVCEALRTAP